MAKSKSATAREARTTGGTPLRQFHSVSLCGNHLLTAASCRLNGAASLCHGTADYPDPHRCRKQALPSNASMLSNRCAAIPTPAAAGTGIYKSNVWNDTFFSRLPRAGIRAARVVPMSPASRASNDFSQPFLGMGTVHEIRHLRN